MFQSPDERGGYCDRGSKPQREAAGYLATRFNPLTSGAGTATLIMWFSDIQLGKSFQSPDERGGYCDLVTLRFGGYRADSGFQSPDERGGYCDYSIGTLRIRTMGEVSIP